jgi:hypothetical protein
VTRYNSAFDVISCRRRAWDLGARVHAPVDDAMFHYSDYLREQATKYRELAEQADDPVVKKEFLELADTCEEVANDLDDRRASG